MADPQASSPQDLLSSLAYQTGGLGAIPQIQQSQYLAAAIKNLQEGSARNIQTKGALGTNLLADAILQFSRGRNNQQLLSSIGPQQTSLMQNAEQAAFGPDGTPPPNAAPGGPPGASGAPPAPAGPAGGGIALPSPGAAPAPPAAPF